MSTPKRLVTPEALPKRPLLDHNTYEQGSSAVDLNGVSVKFGTPKRSHIINAPIGEGYLSRKLRRVALTHARFFLPKTKTYAKRWNVSEAAVISAQHIVSFTVYEYVYSDDPTVGTVQLDILTQLLKEPEPTPSLLLEAAKYIGTDAFDKLLASVDDPERQSALRTMQEDVMNVLTSYRFLHDVIRLNSQSAYYKRRALWFYKYLAEVLERGAEQASQAMAEADQEQGRRKPKTQNYGNGEPTKGYESNRWYPLFVEKPDLEITHSGLMGRKVGYSDTGKIVRNISRFYTDEQRRCFGKKSPALGAVVVFDCSGSMHLSEKDMEEIMASAAGSTVLCYSTGNYASDEYPNAWVVARRGRRVRRLPSFPGGNGCDAPALKYGLGLRQSSKNPVIWVSDQRVTGLNDYCSDNLLDECLHLVRRHNIHEAMDVKQAVRILKSLQGRK